MLAKSFYLLTVLSFLGVSFLVYDKVYNKPKLVYVDSNKLVDGFKGMANARELYKKKAETWRANIDTLSNEVQRQIMAYETDNAKFTANERKLTQELIRTKQKQLQEYQQAINTQAQQEDAKMTGEVVAQINAYLKKYGEAEGYRIILAATQYGNIAYADEGLDITEDVLAGLNKEYLGK